MSDVLSQSQIDELLKSMQSSTGAAGTEDGAPLAAEGAENLQPEAESMNYAEYDFYSPRKFTKEKMRVLTNAFENYARILTSQVNGIFRIMTDITVLDVQEKRYYEYASSLSDSDELALIDVKTHSGTRTNIAMMMHISPGFVLTLINNMLGGGDRILHESDGYRYSDIERVLLKRIILYFTDALKDGFTGYLDFDFELRKLEENHGMMQEVGLDEAVAIVHINVDVSGLSTEKIKICIPGALLEFLFANVDDNKHFARGFDYQDHRNVIMENIRYSQLPITAQLATVKLRLDDINRLKPGDIIDLNKLENSSARLFVGKQPWFTGRMGVYRKNLAVCIDGIIGQAGLLTGSEEKLQDEEELSEAPARQ